MNKMDDKLKVKFIPQIHTLETEEGRSSQMQIANYFMNQFTQYPNKIHILFYESSSDIETKQFIDNSLKDLHSLQRTILFYHQLDLYFNVKEEDLNSLSLNENSIGSKLSNLLKGVYGIKNDYMFIYFLLSRYKISDNVFIIGVPGVKDYIKINERRRILRSRLESLLKLTDQNFMEIIVNLGRIVERYLGITREDIALMTTEIQNYLRVKGIIVNDNESKKIIEIFKEYRLVIDTRERMVINSINRQCRDIIHKLKQRCSHIIKNKNIKDYFNFYLIFGDSHEFHRYSDDNIKFTKVKGFRYNNIIRNSYRRVPRSSIII